MTSIAIVCQPKGSAPQPARRIGGQSRGRARAPGAVIDRVASRAMTYIITSNAHVSRDSVSPPIEFAELPDRARHCRNVGLPKLLLSDFTAAVHFDLHLLAILLRGASVMQGDVGIALLLKTLLDLRLAHLS